MSREGWEVGCGVERAWAEQSRSGRGLGEGQAGVDDANDVVCCSTGGLEKRAHSLMLLTGATRRAGEGELLVGHERSSTSAQEARYTRG